MLRTSYLDTFDWRVHGDGGRLWLERPESGPQLLRWRPVADGGEIPVAAAVDPPVVTARDLPPGFLADRLGPVVAPRALLVRGELDVERRVMRLTDADGNDLVRLTLERARPIGPEGAAEPMTTLEVVELPGGAAAAAAVRAGVPAAGAPPDPLGVAAAARGGFPGDYSSKLDLRFEPGATADVAVRHILAELHLAAVRNVDGTLQDLDPEFLHDLRVAVRRARSALSQLRGVLPEAEATPLAAELKWLGSATGPVRDLDVAFLDLDGHRALLPERLRGWLDPVEAHLRRRRGRARGGLVRALRSRRFGSLMADWESAATAAGGDEARAAALTVEQLARKRIRTTWKKIVRRGAELGEDPPAAALHRLRIDAKKLRYLLEFFRNLYPAETIEPEIKALKKLQDLLGDFNDLSVQRERLVEDAREMLGAGTPPAETLLAMGRLEGLLEDRQEALRLAFHDRFAEFAADDLAAALDAARGGAGA